ncbi:MAG: methylmalonyl-CoA epimerase [Anaerolineae bacterium]|nr:methylmalonyl-CoA epimerase [Anaerolineae bacterium]
MPRLSRINHVAIVVDDVDSALSLWRDALGLPLQKRERNDGEAVEIAFMPIGESEIELIAPTTADSGVAKYLAKRGMGMHHVCLEVDDIGAMMEQLRSKGIELINDVPKINEHGTKYCFIHPKSAFGVMIELYEVPRP